MVKHHVTLIVAMIEEYERCEKVVLDGAHLTVAKVARIGRARDDNVKVELDTRSCKVGVDNTRAWMEAAVERGDNIYGMTTGFGACCDKRTLKVETLQEELVRLLSSGMFVPAPDGGNGEQPISTTRAAMAVRLNSLVLGLSGIRWQVLEALAMLLNANVIPQCPLRGTITASGDLMPLAYIAAVLVGWPTVQAHVPTANPSGATRLVGSSEALAIAGIQKPIKLGAKEGLALVNGTSFATAEASLVVLDLHILFLLSELCTALFCEAMYVRPDFSESMLHEVKHHRGQIEVAATLNWFLRDSPLIRRGQQIIAHQGFTRGPQDRYAVPSIPHWLGPQLESIQNAHIHIENELNSANDNPLVDLLHDRALHGANFQGTYIGFPMDTLRNSIAAIARLVFAQFTELMLEVSNNGLPGNLALGPDFSLDFGLKGLDIAMASYLSEILYLANPVTVHCQSAEQHNQDVNSLGLISARRTAEATHILKMMLASFIVALCQAVELRHLEYTFHTTIITTLQQFAEECGLEASLVEELVRNVEKLDPLRYAHDVTNPSLPLMATLNTILLQYVLPVQNISGDAEVHGRINQIKAFRTKLESDELGQKIQDQRKAFVAMQRGRHPDPTSAIQCHDNGSSPVQMIEGSKTFPLYHFVRQDLRTGMLGGIAEGRRSPDGDLQKVVEAIADGRIIEPMLQCFQGFADN